MFNLGVRCWRPGFPTTIATGQPLPTRKRLHEKGNLRTELILAEFAQLNRLDGYTMTRANHTKDPMQKNNRRHRCLGNICRTYSHWKLPHQICSLMSGMVMKVRMFRCFRWASSTIPWTRWRAGDAHTVMGCLLKCSNMQAWRQNTIYWNCSMILAKQGNWSYHGVTACLLCCQNLGISQKPISGDLYHFNNCLQFFFFIIASTATSPIGLPTVCGPSRFYTENKCWPCFHCVKKIIRKTLVWQCEIWFASLD